MEEFARDPVGRFVAGERYVHFCVSDTLWGLMLWGRPTDVPWGISPRLGEPARHPSQLYEAALEGIVLFLILRLATHRFGQLRRPGAVAGLFMVCYGVFRILVEQVREPDAKPLAGA